MKSQSALAWERENGPEAAARDQQRTKEIRAHETRKFARGDRSSLTTAERGLDRLLNELGLTSLAASARVNDTTLSMWEVNRALDKAGYDVTARFEAKARLSQAGLLSLRTQR